VTVVTGGGSGHEPAFAGYVGDGYLTAAVCGGVFASPSASAALAATRAACGPHGCLVIIMNYTGDRLNFGMALVSKYTALACAVHRHTVLHSNLAALGCTQITRCLQCSTPRL
jgi:dihydroxyacetone kinase